MALQATVLVVLWKIISLVCLLDISPWQYAKRALTRIKILHWGRIVPMQKRSGSSATVWVNDNALADAIFLMFRQLFRVDSTCAAHDFSLLYALWFSWVMWSLSCGRFHILTEVFAAPWTLLGPVKRSLDMQREFLVITFSFCLLFKLTCKHEDVHVESAAPSNPKVWLHLSLIKVKGKPYQQQEIPADCWPICEFSIWSISGS